MGVIGGNSTGLRASQETPKESPFEIPEQETSILSGNNKDTRIAREYHESTKHSEVSVRSSDHELDFGNKPSPFKVYTSLSTFSLPTDFPPPGLNALTANASVEEPRNQVSSTFTLKDLAEILFFSAGITRVIKRDALDYYLRAASATGALYPIELYVACEKIDNLDAGIYHFDPLKFALTRIREGDFRADLVASTDFNRSVGVAPVTIIFSSLAWKNAWKYEARSYRHWFWDAGVIAANLTATAFSLGYKPSLLLGFIDETISNLLGFEAEKEAPVALAPICPSLDSERGFREIKLETERPKKIHVEYQPLSREEITYPMVWQINNASKLKSQLEVSDWIRLSESIPKIQNKSVNTATSRKLEIDTPEPTSSPALGEVILKRGSTRKFDPNKTITFRQLSNVLYYSTRGVPSDFLASGSYFNDIYFISNAVEGLQSGAYFFERERNSIVLLKSGEFRKFSSYLCLEQPLFGDASVVMFMMTQLDPILGYLGNRGYAAAQFEAGVIAGKIYISSYSEGIGASGSTFYDDAVTEFFSPHAKEKSTMIAMGIGVPAYTAKPGKILAGKLVDGVQ